MQENNQSRGDSGGGQKKGGLSWSQPGGQSGGGGQKPMPIPLSGSMPKLTPAARGGREQGSGRRSLIVAFVGGLALGVLAGWIWFGSQASDTGVDSQVQEGGDTMVEETGNTGSTLNTETGSTGSAGSSISSGGLLVTSPQPAGMQVVIANASVAEPTWIVVYESRDGLPGNALGAKLFFPTTRSETVKLLRGTLSGQTYFVGQSLDDGDHIFSLQNDKPIRDAQGNPVWVTFQTQ